MLMPTPVRASQPRPTARDTTMGTRGMTSSKEPMKEPMAMKNSTTTAMSRYRAAPKRPTTRRSIYSISPQRSRLLKMPPITSRKTMTAMMVPLPSAVRTRKGDSSHL